MKKRLFTLMLALIMVMAMFAGCNKAEAPDEPAPADDKQNSEDADANKDNAEAGKTEEEKADADKTEEENTGESEAVNFDGRTLNVVCTSDKYVPMFDEFTKKTGAKVEFISMSSGEVISRTKAEGKAMADLWFGGGLDAFLAAKAEGLLENYQSPNAEDVDARFKDADGAWIAKGITVVGFIGNNSILEEKGLEMPQTWAELADSKYAGEVIMSNPAISGTNYAAVKGLLDMFGAEEGWAYIEKLNANIPFYGKRGKDPQEKTVAGEFAVGIIPADNDAFEVAKDNNLTVVYPTDGIPWVPEGVAIFKGSENVEVAKAFVDFMLEAETQKMIADIDGKDTAQIIKPGVEGYTLGLPEDKLAKEDLTTFGTEREAILERFTKLVEAKEN